MRGRRRRARIRALKEKCIYGSAYRGADGPQPQPAILGDRRKPSTVARFYCAGRRSACSRPYFTRLWRFAASALVQIGDARGHPQHLSDRRF